MMKEGKTYEIETPRPLDSRATAAERDDENYCGLMVVRRAPEGEVKTRFEPLTYER